MARSLCILLIACFGELYAQHTEKLEWKADRSYAVNQYDTAFGFHQFHLRALSYTRDQRIAWTITLPERMQRYIAASVYDKSVLDDGTFRKASPDEIDINDHKEFLKCPELILDHAIAVADQTSFLLLDKKRGTILADLPDEIAAAENFYVDSGRYEITVNKIACAGTLQHGAEFIAPCAGYLFHFSGSVLYVFDRKNKLIAKTAYSAKSQGKSKGAGYMKAVFNGKNYSIVITGRVYLR
ncbi:hypothetical protein KK083_02265 [Fulvivirgaceae bacterium PWU4]|uniref:WG repeat-containing protein n=1 Tax=Chryseosolibacter histidini TaxID=2782349 RepID=A0AAP2DHV9_9BACT|nr:hypothetical protein [Chryseosolibacter histidini]MBT1695683.1 hypothetical protein [Chryseosolibacter histidini]